MNKPDLQNERLDRAARRLLETARVSGEELDRIAASPRLFESVKAGIEAEQRRRESKGFFGNRRNLTIWSWQKTGAALAVLMFFALAALGVIVLTRRDSPTGLAEQINAPQINPPIAPVDVPPPAQIPPEIAETKNSGRAPRAVFQKAVSKNENSALPKAAARKNNPVKRQATSEPEGEFYALTYTANPVEPGEHLKIVRAELSRASLFALGVNLPIENESEKIKTDLLVGADGIAKAIRFVR
jgi:hypothetical protein